MYGHTRMSVQQNKNCMYVYVGVCNGADNSADDSVCVCVYRMVISVNYRFWAPYTGCQPCFQGLILALAIISWAFAHVQHVGL